MSDFQSIGAQLKQARENKELTLQDVEKQTRIRLKFLQAIEFGQFFIIDNPTQLRGFLRKYARTVGLDDIALLAAYEDALQGERKRSRRPGRKLSTNTLPSDPKPIPNNQPVRVERAGIDTARYANRLPETYQSGQRRSLQTIVLLGLAIGFVGLIVGGVVLVLGEFGNRDDNSAPDTLIQSINIGGSPASQPSITPTLAAQPTVIGTPVLAAGQSLTVELTAEVRLWVQVEVDGGVLFEGLFRPGDGASYQPSDYITIRTTNAGGLTVRLNGQPFVLGQGRQSITRTVSVSEGILPAEGQSSLPLSAGSTQAVVADEATSTEPTASPSPEQPTQTATILLSTNTPTGPPTSTSIPILGFATATATPTPSPEQPTATPTFTASPFLPARATSTATPDKGT